jgi:hypothetical protein
LALTHLMDTVHEEGRGSQGKSPKLDYVLNLMSSATVFLEYLRGN